MSCFKQVQRMRAVLDTIPSTHQIDSHSECMAAFAMLHADPTYENLKALREALDNFENTPFVN